MNSWINMMPSQEVIDAFIKAMNAQNGETYTDPNPPVPPGTIDLVFEEITDSAELSHP